VCVYYRSTYYKAFRVREACLDPPLWIVPNKALSLSLSLSLFHRLSRVWSSLPITHWCVYSNDVDPLDRNLD
jgi:hypothetical protein